MFIGKDLEVSRRAFMQRTAQLSAMGAASSYALGLSGIGEAAAFSSAGDYKALVCVFLYGGNDQANTLIPYDSANYARYRAIRGEAYSGTGVGLQRDQLASSVLNQPADQVLTDDIRYALAPSMPRMKALFDSNKMAPLLNVGPLVAPLTKAQYDSPDINRYPRPAKLFSHNDQQSTWQSSQPEGSTSGWGGRMGDLAQSGNTNAMFTAINAAGNAVFLSGDQVAPFQVTQRGAIEINGLDGWIYGSRDCGAALRQLVTRHTSNVFQTDYAQTMARSIEYGQFINNALETANVLTAFDESSSLAAQLQLVARMIAARGQLGVKRQVFMVQLGGFDHHDGLNEGHREKLAELDGALDAFYRATVELGVANGVTTFTASDFGRTLTSNGNGSDHGWGSHHFIVGGAVNGGRFYGTAPSVSVDTDDQVDQGRLLPSTSVDQYSATLAKWFGVSTSELPSVAPNIGRFATSDLGFMAA